MPPETVHDRAIIGDYFMRPERLAQTITARRDGRVLMHSIKAPPLDAPLAKPNMVTRQKSASFHRGEYPAQSVFEENHD